MAANTPTSNLQWASTTVTDPISGQPNKVATNSAKKTAGWYFLEKPPFNWFNYWMNGVYQWLNTMFSGVLASVTSGTDNYGLGTNALANLTTGTDCIGIGTSALNNNILGQWCQAIGSSALSANLGNANVAIGHLSMSSNTTGIDNTAIGYRSLTGNVSGSFNVSVGQQSMQNNQASHNIGVGSLSLSANTTGTYNIAIGSSSLVTSVSGSQNVSIGYQSLTAMAGSASQGNSNVAVGYQAGSALNGAGNANYNTIIGCNAGSNLQTGLNCILIGYNATASGAAAVNEITLGNNYTTGGGTVLRCNTTTITGISDKRDKADITDLEVGLDFINSLKPRTWHWDKREWYDDGVVTGEKKESNLSVGFIAQELKEVQENFNADYLKLVYESNPDKLEASSGNLLTPLIKAVQELSIKVFELESKLNG